MTEQIDTIIVGGGQAGLATSFYLKQQGSKHIILEQAGQCAKAWRERWDSFTLITPNCLIRLPGAEYRGNDPNGFMPRDDVITYFEAYIEQFELPIRYGIRVTAVEPLEMGYLVRTDYTDFEAANVVIATGMYQHPRIPVFSRNLPLDIHQLHSSEYRNPQTLPAGAILVVGSAQSGAQIAEELNHAGRKVYLSVGSSGRFPRRYRGKDATLWIEEMGLSDRTVDNLSSPQAKFTGSAHGTGKDGGHTINLHQFVRDGIVLLGHIQSIQGNRIMLAPDLKENLAKADKEEADFIKDVDNYIEKHGLDAPVDSLPELCDGFEVADILDLDLKIPRITSVIWATGYKYDFSMVKLPVFDEDGYPVQKRGVTEFPGLYFIGLPFLYKVKSGTLAGVGDDAAYIVEYIGERIDALP
jgi:putative flavoprotein involved in K+ transport